MGELVLVPVYKKRKKEKEGRREGGKEGGREERKWETENPVALTFSQSTKREAS